MKYIEFINQNFKNYRRVKPILNRDEKSKTHLFTNNKFVDKILK